MLAFAPAVTDIGTQFGEVIDLVAQLRWRISLGWTPLREPPSDFGMKLWCGHDFWKREGVLLCVFEGFGVIQQGLFVPLFWHVEDARTSR
jgi:hypothetical protein